MGLKRQDELRHTQKTITFDGTAGNGATGTVNLFTLQTRILVVDMVPYCTSNLVSAGGGTLSLGTASNPTVMIAATTATDIDSGEFWFDTTPAADEAVSATCKELGVTGDIILTVGTADITGGTIEFDLYWMALTDAWAVTPA